MKIGKICVHIYLHAPIQINIIINCDMQSTLQTAIRFKIFRFLKKSKNLNFQMFKTVLDICFCTTFKLLKQSFSHTQNDFKTLTFWVF